MTFPIFGAGGMEEMGMNLQDMLGGMFPKQRRRRTVTVAEARRILLDQEAERMIDLDQVTGEAIDRAEQSGIIFIDEMDKIAGREKRRRRAGREPGGRAAGPAAHRRGLDGDDEVRPGADQPHAVHRGGRLPCRQALRPDPRAAGPLPAAGRADRRWARRTSSASSPSRRTR